VPQFALVLALVQVGSGHQRQGVRERLVRIRRERIELIQGGRDAGIRTEICGNFLRLGLVHADPRRLKGWVAGLEFVLDFLPGKALLRKAQGRQADGQQRRSFELLREATIVAMESQVAR